ncbi:SIR2 family protein [Streptomyces sp. NPDC048751]|uniref:SIR2 family protein n=1 Tax=Streptomyces sp. NPDC048751 TaxID=3365591 RepID=UPI00371153D0
MADYRDEAFFHRAETKELINEIAGHEALVIYAGAGATMDMSALSWERLVTELLEPHMQSTESREWLMKTLDPQKAASAACQFYKDLYDKDAKGRILDRVRVALYKEGTWAGGALAKNIAELIDRWYEHDRRACVVTPNFDDYIETELRDKVHKSTEPFFVDPDGPPIDIELPNKDTPACVYLCGHAPRNGKSRAHPVLSEEDFLRNAVCSTELLTGVFERSNVLILGSSLVDPPLMTSLLHTAEHSRVNGKKRYALISLQDDKWKEIPRDISRDLRRAIYERLAQFNVTPIFTDFYIQIGQFLQEVRTAVQERRGGCRYDHPLSKATYGARLVSWWDGWWKWAFEFPADNQRKHHEYLMRMLDEQVRPKLKAPPGEHLKIEVWLRWNPKAERKLCLWASSTGTWPDASSMQKLNISSKDESGGREPTNSAMLAFTNGRPILGETPPGAPTRWRSYLSAPIWYMHENGPVAVGVITLASDLEADGAEMSSIAKRNRARIAEVIPKLDNLGRQLADSKLWDDGA